MEKKKENIFHAEAHTVILPTKIKNYDHMFLRAPPLVSGVKSGVKWFNRTNIRQNGNRKPTQV